MENERNRVDTSFESERIIIQKDTNYIVIDDNGIEINSESGKLRFLNQQVLRLE